VPAATGKWAGAGAEGEWGNLCGGPGRGGQEQGGEGVVRSTGHVDHVAELVGFILLNVMGGGAAPPPAESVALHDVIVADAPNVASALSERAHDNGTEQNSVSTRRSHRCRAAISPREGKRSTNCRDGSATRPRTRVGTRAREEGGSGRRGAGAEAMLREQHGYPRHRNLTSNTPRESRRRA